MVKTPIILTVNGNDLEGWLTSSISKSIEELSGTFDVSLALNKNELLPVKRQDKVVIKINGHQVMAGYVLQSDPYYSREEAGIRVQGRDFTGDLVAASALHGKGQWINARLDQIARDLCKPFDVSVDARTSVGKPIARFELDQGETVAEALDRAASYRGVLVTRTNKGQLLITVAGDRHAEASIVLGVNVISMEPAGSDQDRHSEYIVQGQGEINTIGDARQAQSLKGRATDKHLARYLPLIVQADNSSEQHDLQQQAEHMARVRVAQAFRYTYTVEGWVGKDGKPWEINTLVPIYDELLGLNGKQLLIVAVNFSVSREEGDITELTVCPVDAYTRIPLPIPKNGRTGSSRKGKRKRDGIVPDWR